MASIVSNQQDTNATVNPHNLADATPVTSNTPSTLTIEGKSERKNISCELNSALHLMSSITAISEVPKVNGESEKRQDVELVLVIDKSGSMSGEKKLNPSKKLCFYYKNKWEAKTLCLWLHLIQMYNA